MSRVPGKISGDRAAILGAISQAMTKPTEAHVVAPPDRSRYADYLPAVGDDFESRLATFATRCEGLRAKLIVVDYTAAAEAAVRDIVQTEAESRIAWHDHPLVTPIVHSLGLPNTKAEANYDRGDLERCTVGLTGCDALIAQTGSVFVSAVGQGGRTLTVLPPHHIVIASADQLLPDLPTAWANHLVRPDRDKVSMVSLISGPSRTGDIERILVLGAHGPKQLTIILIKNA